VLYFRFDQLENLGVGEDSLADDIRDLSFYQNHGDIEGPALLEASKENTAIACSKTQPAADFELSQNYPNPFNPTTRIDYGLAVSGRVSLKIFNVRGQLVRTIVDQMQTAGRYTVAWDGRAEQLRWRTH